MIEYIHIYSGTPEAPQELLATIPIPMQPCVRCGTLMSAIKGSKAAVCQVCGWKDDCCLAPELSGKDGFG